MSTLTFFDYLSFNPTIFFVKSILYIIKNQNIQIDMSRIENPNPDSSISNQSEEELQRINKLIGEGKVIDCGKTTWGVPLSPSIQTNGTKGIDAGTTTYGYWVKTQMRMEAKKLKLFI